MSAQANEPIVEQANETRIDQIEQLKRRQIADRVTAESNELAAQLACTKRTARELLAGVQIVGIRPDWYRLIGRSEPPAAPQPPADSSAEPQPLAGVVDDPADRAPRVEVPAAEPQPLAEVGDETAAVAVPHLEPVAPQPPAPEQP